MQGANDVHMLCECNHLQDTFGRALAFAMYVYYGDPCMFGVVRAIPT